MDFRQASREFRRLKAQYKAGKLSEKKFKSMLQELMVQDPSGAWWMIGYDTERWYRHDGSSWVQVDPAGLSPDETFPGISPPPRKSAARLLLRQQAERLWAVRAMIPRAFNRPLLLVGLLVPGMIVALAALATNRVQTHARQATAAAQVTMTELSLRQAATREAGSTGTAVAASTETAIAASTSTAVAASASTGTALAASTDAAFAQASAEAGAQATSTAAARSKLIGDFARLYVAASSKPPTFSSPSGSLSHSPDVLSIFDSGVTATDFLVVAEFTNPYATSTGAWDYGFLFRDQGRNDEYRLYITSDKRWKLYTRTPTASTFLDGGPVPALKTSSDATNMVWLASEGDRGLLLVNGDFVAELDLSARPDAGRLKLGTGFQTGHTVAGHATKYEKFTIWKIR